MILIRMKWISVLMTENLQLIVEDNELPDAAFNSSEEPAPVSRKCTSKNQSN